MFLGVDIGSSSSKAVIVNGVGEILAAEVVNLGTGTKGIARAVEAALAAASLRREDIAFTVATGYGRMNFTDADKQITEISCHAKGVRFASAEARTVIDIGGQDTKVIRLSASGSVENFVMNDKCAAGTGRFLEVMSRVLDCPIAALGDLAVRGENPVSISNMCTVFAESEVISQLSAGVSVENVAAGAILSIAGRVAGMAKRVGVAPKVVMTGGGALNHALVSALAKELETEITAIGNPQVMGALGAALFAAEQYHKAQAEP